MSTLSIDNLPIQWTSCSFAELDTVSLYEILVLRQQIFVVEQECPYQDADGLDFHAMHIQGRMDNKLICYARIFPPTMSYNTICVTIGRVIVDAQYRHLKIGSVLVLEAENQSIQYWGKTPFFLSAQAHLHKFYGNLGYVQCGEGYDEDNIPHIPMIKQC